MLKEIIDKKKKEDAAKLEAQLEVLSDIFMHHIGKGNAISSNEIASRLGISDGVANPGTRALIKECIKKYQLPVAANGRGYYMIDNQLECDEYCKSLELRAEQIMQRRNDILEYFTGFDVV